MAYLTAEPFEIPHASFRRHFHVAEDLEESRFITYLNFYLRFSSTAITKHGFKFFSRNFVPVFHSAANFSKIFFRDRCKVGCFHFHAEIIFQLEAIQSREESRTIIQIIKNWLTLIHDGPRNVENFQRPDRISGPPLSTFKLSRGIEISHVGRRIESLPFCPHGP